MLDNIICSGCSAEYLEKQLSVVKRLQSKVKLMTKPDNFTYIECAELCQILEDHRLNLEALLKKTKQVEGLSA